MSGQAANLTLKEATAMQARTQCGINSQGSKTKSSNKASAVVLKKKKGAQN